MEMNALIKFLPCSLIVERNVATKLIIFRLEEGRCRILQGITLPASKQCLMPLADKKGIPYIFVSQVLLITILLLPIPSVVPTFAFIFVPSTNDINRLVPLM